MTLSSTSLSSQSLSGSGRKAGSLPSPSPRLPTTAAEVFYHAFVPDHVADHCEIGHHAGVNRALVVMSLPFALIACRGPVATPPDESSAMSFHETAADHLAWTRTRETSLSSPEGWLSLVALAWLPVGDTTLSDTGTPNARRIVLANAGGPDAGVFTRDERDVVRFRPSPTVTATLDDRPLASDVDVVLEDDRTGSPPVLRVGGLHVTHLHRHDRAALRIRDRQAPTRIGFEGIPRFDFDPGWVLPASFEPAMAGTTIPITLVTRHVETHPIAGTLRFEIDGRAFELLAEQAGDDLFVVFGDVTNRDSTYGGGRFLIVPAPDAGGRTLLDFNRSINPPCAFTDFATCPTPPASNRLGIAVNAGERSPHS